MTVDKTGLSKGIFDGDKDISVDRLKLLWGSAKPAS